MSDKNHTGLRMVCVCLALMLLSACSSGYEGVPKDGRPHINGAKVYGSRAGTDFLYTIAATGDRPMTFSAKGLPKGLTLDKTSGIITGKPAEKGESSVSVTAKNSKGTAEATLRFVIGDTLALTPPMGWMSWNALGPNLSETLIKEIADAMVASGMRDVGYQYICIDDHWHGKRDADGVIHPNAKKFPNGIKPVADYVHSKGLKLGIYSDAAEHTCGGEPGSFGYESQDAQSYAQWGIDYLKYDYCGAPKDRETAIKRYRAMARELEKTDRTIVFAACEWGPRQPWLWAGEVGANLWRTTWDIRDTWDHGKYDSGHAGIVTILDRQAELWSYAGPGRWNDPDMLVVGLKGKGLSSSHDGANGCTEAEYRSNMALWSLMASPLLASCDLRSMDDTTTEILTNPEIIAVNQDSLGRQGRRVYQKDAIEIWVKPLEDDHLAVGILNRSAGTVEFDATWPKIGIDGRYGVWDLWAREKRGEFDKSMTVTLQSHETAIFRLWPTD